jgi:hypothetical protein
VGFGKRLEVLDDLGMRLEQLPCRAVDVLAHHGPVERLRRQGRVLARALGIPALGLLGLPKRLLGRFSRFLGLGCQVSGRRLLLALMGGLGRRHLDGRFILGHDLLGGAHWTVLEALARILAAWSR